MLVVISGMSSWAGPIVGAFVLASLPTWLGFAGDWRPVVTDVVSVIIVVLLPGGIVGTVIDAVKKIAARSRRTGSPLAQPPRTEPPHTEPPRTEEMVGQ